MIAFEVSRGKLRPVHKPRPGLRSGWALVRVRLAGICNTDLEILRGYHGFRGTPGHEFVGEVAALGSASRKEKARWLGRRVTGEINIACPAYGYRPVCAFCKRGLPTHCARRRVLGIVGHDGAFAEYLALPVANLHRVPVGVSDEQAVFVEPLAAACEILDQVRVRRFPVAAVLGDGKLAQLVAMALGTVIPRVVLFGKHPEKLALARGAGMETRRVQGDAADLRRVRESFPLLVEATGSPSGLALALLMTEPRGTLVVKSTFHGAAAVETWPMVVKELTLVGSRCGPFRKALELVRSGQVDPRPLIARTYALEDAPAAMAFARRRGVLKVLLRASRPATAG